jgi:hypothetical protein
MENFIFSSDLFYNGNIEVTDENNIYLKVHIHNQILCLKY